MQFLFQYVHRHVALHFSRSGLLFRFRKGFLVHLLVLVERDALDLHRHSRHHVRRFFIHDEVVEGFDVNLLICNDISCDEFAAALFVKGLHSSILDTGELKDDTFDLLEFDAETADLHLSVFAPHELDVTVGKIAHDVAGAVNVSVFLVCVEGIVDIDFNGLLGTVEVAAGYLWSGDPEFTCHTHG